MSVANGSNGWVEVADVCEFEQIDRKGLRLPDRRELAVFKVDGVFYALAASCSHERASLLLGQVKGTEVSCPLHGARFDLATGRHLSLPAVRPVKSYAVKVENGKVYVQT